MWSQHKARQSRCRSIFHSIILNLVKSSCKRQNTYKYKKTRNIVWDTYCMHSIWKNLFNISTNCLGFSKEILFWFKFRQIHLLEFYTGVEFSIKFSTLSFAVDSKPILDAFVLSFNIEKDCEIRKAFISIFIRRI